jgi:hypothetical protein
VCGSPLQLDVLSLNRKLLGEHSKKLHCLTCMADLFECAVEDVVGKLGVFKREGCRLPLPGKGSLLKMKTKLRSQMPKGNSLDDASRRRSCSRPSEA